jgi:hypothetical protein
VRSAGKERERAPLHIMEARFLVGLFLGRCRMLLVACLNLVGKLGIRKVLDDGFKDGSSQYQSSDDGKIRLKSLLMK